MCKLRMGNITVYLLEDYEVGENTDIAKDAIKRIREMNKHTIYFECLRDELQISKDFMSNGYAVEEVNNNNLNLGSVKTMEELINKLEYSITVKDVKEVYFNYPDTIVDEMPNLPEDYDFIALLMRIIVNNAKTYGKIKFNLTV